MEHFFHQPLRIEEWIGLIVLASVVGGMIIGAIAVVTNYFLERERDEMNATLKMTMLERGMSSEEIVNVLKAGVETHDPAPWTQHERPRRHRHCFSARRAMHEALEAAERKHGHA